MLSIDGIKLLSSPDSDQSLSDAHMQTLNEESIAGLKNEYVSNNTGKACISINGYNICSKSEKFLLFLMTDLLI